MVFWSKEFKVGMEKVGRMNVLVAAPGRLLYHMHLDYKHLQMLVLHKAGGQSESYVSRHRPEHARNIVVLSVIFI